MSSVEHQKEESLVSVIIPAYNEEEFIGEALKSIQTQSYDRIQTIVVANNCTDDTARIARGFPGKVIEIPQQGISHAKNVGFSAAEGSICAFMDADSEAKDDLVEKVYKACLEGYNCGKATIKPLDDPRFRARFFCKYWEMWSRITEHLPIDSGTGAFTFLTKEFGQKIQNPDRTLYREDLLVMEDIEFAARMKKMGGKWKFIDDSYLSTSMRRFIEEGYLKCFVGDFLDSLHPKGKTRKRWKDKG
jgi:glycosyltransferase involved in cell wall biosynthesis